MRSSDSYARCGSCRREYFNVAATRRCPHCGHRLRWLPRHAMTWAMGLIALLLLAYAMVEIAGAA
jgi:DNA-directed RNA polymerase subunit RPC12/RpoP